MSALIQQLEHDHATLRAAIARIRACDFAADASRLELAAMRGAMFLHLMKEDRHLYPALIACAATHPILRDVVDRYQRDMERVVGIAFSFFRTHGDGPAKPDFATGLAHLCDVIEQRMEREEALLYPTWLKLVASEEIREAEAADAR